MVRALRRSVVIVLASVGLMLSGCSSDGGSTPVGPAVGPSYVHGNFEGSLALQLIKTFAPMTWNGQTDGPVLVSADNLFTLSDDQVMALRAVLSGGHAILVSEVTRDHLARLHDLNKSVPAISLDQADSAALYVLAQPRGMRRVLVVKSVPYGIDPSEIESIKTVYAKQVAQWFLEQRQLYGSAVVKTALRDSAYETTDAPTVLGSENLPWSYTQLFSMPAYYSNTCNGTKMCTDAVSLTLSSWAVHNPWELPDQPSDYVIVRMSGSVLTAGCKLAIGSDNRFAGYWLRQFNMSANVADVTLGGYRLVSGTQIMDGEYRPLAANPDETYQSGVSFSMSGSGTISASAKGPSGSLGFNAGVSYSNTKTITFPAVVTTPKIPDLVNPTKALWTYDAWNHVKNNIKPANHACGGPGLKVGTALPTIIYGGTFSPEQEWVWALKRGVRNALPVANGFSKLPVQFNASLLLGWAFYWQAIGYCTQSSATGYHFKIDNGDITGGTNIDIVGQTNVAPLLPNEPLYAGNGLAFDPGCGTDTNFGTIPLGDRHSGVQNGSNAGPPFEFGPINVDVPLAPDPAPMTLTSISPTSGPQGTVVTLRGTSLNTATSVNFGGQPAASMSMEWAVGQEPVLTVTAPMRISPVGIPVNISVQNAVKTSENFLFTYTN